MRAAFLFRWRCFGVRAGASVGADLRQRISAANSERFAGAGAMHLKSDHVKSGRSGPRTTCRLVHPLRVPVEITPHSRTGRSHMPRPEGWLHSLLSAAHRLSP